MKFFSHQCLGIFVKVKIEKNKYFRGEWSESREAKLNFIGGERSEPTIYNTYETHVEAIHPKFHMLKKNCP